MIFLPFAKFLLPTRRERPDLAADKAVDPALRVHPFLEPVGRHTGEFPKASRVRDKGPNRRWRLGEPNFPPEAIDRTLLSKLMGSRSRQSVRLLYAKSERIGLPKCTSLARSARQVSLVLLPAATRRASDQPRSAAVFGRSAQIAVGRRRDRIGQIDPIAKSLERAPNWHSRSKVFTVAASA